MRVKGDSLSDGAHHLVIVPQRAVRRAELECATTSHPRPHREGIPRDPNDDYGSEIIGRRHRYLEEFSSPAEHVNQYSFDPHVTQGNIESFIGVAQVPIGLAGPLRLGVSTPTASS